MTEDYKYDVFISYKNHDLTIGWVTQFEKMLKYCLTQDLGGRDPNIFFDKESIDTGTKWPRELQEGLKYSKTIVCIWTPEYFKSNWCLSEWLSFEEREKIFYKDKINLIFPLRFHDGEHYPENAKERQSIDIRKYNSTLKAFWDSPNALPLEIIIQEFSNNLAKKIRLVPPFREDFPILVDHSVSPETIVPHLKL